MFADQCSSQARKPNTDASVPAPRPASVAGAERIGVKSRSPSSGAFGAETRCRKFFDSPIVRSDTQSCAQLESLRARVSYMPRCEFLPTTVLPTAAQIQYRRRYRSAFGHPRPPIGIPPPYVVDEDPDATHPLTYWPWNTAHPDYHQSQDRETSKASPALDRKIVQTSTSATRPSSHEAVLADQLRPETLDPRSPNRLSPGTISGEITAPSRAEACNMQSTGSGNDVVIAHADPHSTSYATEPSDEHVQHRAALGNLPITTTTDTPPAPTVPVCVKTSADQSSGYPRPKASTSVDSKPSRAGTGYPCGTNTSDFKLTPTAARTNGSKMSPCRLRVPYSKISLGGFTCSAPIRLMIHTSSP